MDGISRVYPGDIQISTWTDSEQIEIIWIQLGDRYHPISILVNLNRMEYGGLSNSNGTEMKCKWNLTDKTISLDMGIRQNWKTTSQNGTLGFSWFKKPFPLWTNTPVETLVWWLRLHWGSNSPIAHPKLVGQQQSVGFLQKSQSFKGFVRLEVTVKYENA